MIIRFKIIGQPISKARPRFFRQGIFVGSYTPKNTKRWEEFVRLQSLQYRPDKLIEGAIDMKLVFYLARPKSLPQKEDHIKKPDIENLAKSILDALEGIFYHNDSQITRLELSKHYTLDVPGVEVEIEAEGGEKDGKKEEASSACG